MIEEQEPLIIRSKIVHDSKKETDIYMTKNSIITSLISTIEKRIHKFGFVDVHSLGAANYKALKLALLIVKAHPNELDTTVKTDTVETNDFVVPTTPDQQREVKHRELNSVHIHIFRKGSKS
ncbi:hypothetical protein M9Y10_028221 [Tritrichomonas musculus]|uniref:DNA/RNA-binding protein Alba-like domain-containing protein n=1 Tax=Tritrichomonas musculus TaxID=1915356 RepID=A0ABR2KJM8_9EUKA